MYTANITSNDRSILCAGTQNNYSHVFLIFLTLPFHLFHKSPKNLGFNQWLLYFDTGRETLALKGD